MGKKSKKSKKRKSKKQKGPQTIQGVSKFDFPNGDEYEGEFVAHRSGLVWRQGRGIYRTHDGQIYEGQWKDDKLDEKENVKVDFPNGDRYFGRLSKNKFNGAGSYEFKNGTNLAAQLLNNKPTGQVALIDYLRKIWFGQAEKEHVLVFQEHVFSYELDENRGKGTPKHPKIPQVEENPEIFGELEPELTYSELEKRIFAKSTKTEPDPILDDTETEWYQNYRETDELFSRISKIAPSDLTHEEKIWLKNHKKSLVLLERFKKNRNKKSGNCVTLSSGDNDEDEERSNLLDRFFGEEFGKSCRPVRVLYVSERTQVERNGEDQEEEG